MRLARVILAGMLLVAFASQVSAERDLLQDYDYQEECDSWDYDWDANYRFVGGTAAGVYSAATAAKCGDLCIEEDGCYSFNFYKRYVPC